jgi:subtilisin family serine protease
MRATSAAVEALLPFAGATGRGLKIAVIDSGVNARHPHICAATRGVVLGEDEDASLETSPVTGSRAGSGRSFQLHSAAGCSVAGPADDDVGHGTAVTAAIQEKAPGAEYYAVKLFGTSLRTNTARLIQAIEWAIDQRMDLVNLSLGTPNFEHRAPLEALVEHAAAAGVLLVSARHTGQRPVLPGVLPGVIGVDVDWNLPRHCYRIGYADGMPCFYASGFPRSLPGVPPSRNLNGISFAVANMTGFAARACEDLTVRSFERLRDLLAARANGSQF